MIHVKTAKPTNCDNSFLFLLLFSPFPSKKNKMLQKLDMTEQQMVTNPLHHLTARTLTKPLKDASSSCTSSGKNLSHKTLDFVTSKSQPLKEFEAHLMRMMSKNNDVSYFSKTSSSTTAPSFPDCLDSLSSE